MGVYKKLAWAILPVLILAFFSTASAIPPGTFVSQGRTTTRLGLNFQDWTAFTANDTTPDIYGETNFKTANTGSTTISDFDNGIVGDLITVYVNDGNTVFDFAGGTLYGNGGAAYTATQNDILQFMKVDATHWACTFLGKAAPGSGSGTMTTVSIGTTVLDTDIVTLKFDDVIFSGTENPENTAVIELDLTPTGGLTAATLTRDVTNDAVMVKYDTTDIQVLSTGIALAASPTVPTSILPSAAGGATIGSATLEWGNIYLTDAASIQMGADQDFRITHDPDDGMTLSVHGATNNEDLNIDLETNANTWTLSSSTGVNILRTVADDITVLLDSVDADDTDWWIKVDADQGASSDDPLEIGNNATPGTSPILSLAQAGSATFSGAVYFNSADDYIDVSADDTFDFTRNDTGVVTITASDNDVTADLTVLPGGAAALTLGGANTTSVAVTTDGGTITLDGSYNVALDANSTVMTLSADYPNTGAQVGLLITSNDDDSANFDPFQIRDDSGGNNDLLFFIDHTGSVTTGIWNAGAVTSSASITSGASFIIGSADINETDLEKLDGITNGTQAANKAVVADANVNTGISKITELHIGTSGSEAQVTATAAELNYLDITTLGTGAPSKAVVLNADGNYTAPAGTWDLSNVTGITLNTGEIVLADLAAGVYAVDLVTTAPVTGSTDNVLVGADADVTIALDFTAAWNFGGSASLELPNGTSGTTDTTGQIYLDTDGNGGDFDGPVLQVSTNGATLGYAILMSALPSDDNYIIKYDAATDTVSWEADQSAGSPTLDSVENPTAAWSPTLGDTEIVTWTAEETDADPFIIQATGAFVDISIVKIDQNTGNPTDGTMLEIATDDADVDHLLLQFGASDYVTHKIVDAGTYTIDVTSDGTASITLADPVSFNDQNITNVGSLALDSIGADDTDISIVAASGTVTVESVVFTGGALTGVTASDGLTIGDGGETNYLTISDTGGVTFTGTANIDLPADSVDAADMAHEDHGEISYASGSAVVDDTGIELTSITIGALLGVNSIDATDAVDMDYGSVDVLDHTFTSAGGILIIDGSIQFPDADGSPAAAGELQYDNTVTGLDDGALVWYDDDEVQILVGLDSSETLESGDDGKTLSYNWNGGSGYWALSSAGSGDIITVGDCTGVSGVCFGATAGDDASTSLYFEGATGDAYELKLTTADIATADRTVTLRDADGTVIISGDTLGNHLSGTFDTDGSTDVTVVDFALNTDADAGNADILSLDKLEGVDATVYVDLGSTDTLQVVSDVQIELTTPDVIQYHASNDGNPEYRIGAADAEEVVIQAFYDSGAQTIDYLLIETQTEDDTADEGRIVFSVDEATVLTIDDGGLELGASMAITGTTAITLGSGTATTAITSSDWAIDATGAITGVSLSLEGGQNNSIDNIANTHIASAAGIAATKINTGDVDNTEFNYLDGVTDAIQTQINNIVNGTTGFSSYIAVGSSDPADAGAIRLENAAAIMFESSPTGADISALTVTSGEVVQIGASGASGVTITPAATFSGGIASAGTISAGVWQGTKIVDTYLDFGTGGSIRLDDIVNADGDYINTATDDTFDFTRNDSGTVIITASDNDATANLTVQAGSAGTLTLGSGSDTVAVNSSSWDISTAGAMTAMASAAFGTSAVDTGTISMIKGARSGDPTTTISMSEDAVGDFIIATTGGSDGDIHLRPSGGTVEIGTSGTVIGSLELHDAGTLKIWDDGNDQSVTLGPVGDGTTVLGVTGTINATGLQIGGSAVIHAGSTWSGGDLGGTGLAATVTDLTIGSAHGDILYRNNVGSWVALAPGGTNGQVLTTHTAGVNPTWETVTATPGGDGSPAGQIQYEASGQLGAEDAFYYTSGTDLLAVGNIAYSGYISSGAGAADSGQIRLSNTNTIEWEAAPAGTNMTIAGSVDEDIVLTVAATDYVQVATGNLRVGSGTPGQTHDGEDAYVTGLVEIDGMLYAEGGITLQSTDLIQAVAGNDVVVRLGDSDDTDKFVVEKLDGTDVFTVDSSGNIPIGGIADSVTWQDNADATKVLAFQLSSITTSTTRTVTWPDSDITPAGLAIANVFTAAQTIRADNPILNLEDSGNGNDLVGYIEGTGDGDEGQMNLYVRTSDTPTYERFLALSALSDATSFIVGPASPQDIVMNLIVRGDADSDASEYVTESLTVALTPAATSTNATWAFTSSQGAGYTFDKAVTFTGGLTGNVTGNCSGSAGTVTDGELAAIQGLTFTDASIIQLTGAAAAAVLASGGNHYFLSSTSDNSALEFKTPANTVAALESDIESAIDTLSALATVTTAAGLDITPGTASSVALELSGNNANDVWIPQRFINTDEGSTTETAQAIDLSFIFQGSRDNGVSWANRSGGRIKAGKDSDYYHASDGTDEDSNMSFLVAVNGTNTQVLELGSDLLATFAGNIIIPNAGNIGAASYTDAIAIASDGKVTLSQDLIMTGNIELNHASANTLTASGGVLSIEGTALVKSSADVSSAGVIADSVVVETWTLGGGTSFDDDGITNVANIALDSITADGTIILIGDNSDQVQVNGQVAGANDGYYDGWTREFTVDSGVGNTDFGQAYHVDTDGDLIDADADATTTMPAIGLAVDTGTGASKQILLRGLICETDWAWTVGGIVYVSADPTTTEGLTQTAPAGTGDQVQVVGIATTADCIEVNMGGYVLVEVP